MTDDGNALFKAGDFRGAIAAYQSATTLSGELSTAVNAWSNIALCFLRLNDPISAWKACCRGLILKADHVKLTYRAAASILSAAAANRQNARLSADDAETAFEAEFPTLADVDSTASRLAALCEAAPDGDLHEQLAKLMRARECVNRRLYPPKMTSMEHADSIAAAAPVRGAHRRPRMLLPVAPAMFKAGAIADLRFQHSEDGVDENLLVLLHGLGDSAAGFARFGAGMELPQTSVLSLSGPQTVPVVGGHAWFTAIDRESFEPLSLSHPHPVRAADVAKLVPQLYASLLDIAAARRVTLDHVHLLGFGDGGTVALHLALHARDAVLAARASAASSGSGSTGGPRAVAHAAGSFDAASNPQLFAAAVSIGGPLLPETRRSPRSAPGPGVGDAATDAPAATQIFFMTAARLDGSIAAECAETTDALEKLGFSGAIRHVLLPPPHLLKDDIAKARLLRKGPKPHDDDGSRDEPPIARIPRGREEVEPLMAFFASRLRRRLTALEDDESAVELA